MIAHKSSLITSILIAIACLMPLTSARGQSSKARVVQGPQTYSDIKREERRLEEARAAREAAQNKDKVRYVKVYKPAHQATWTWTPEASPEGPVKIEVFLKEQRMFVWRGNEIIAETEISSGRSGFETRPGYYKIIQKRPHHTSNMYGTVVNKETGAVVTPNATPRTPVPAGAYYRPAPMPHWQRLTNSGLGFHAGFLPGRADSHGCIRLPEVMAENVYSVTQVGTPVVIYPHIGAVMPKTAKNDFTNQSTPTARAAADSPGEGGVIKPLTSASASPAPKATPAAESAPAAPVAKMKPNMESFIPPKAP